MCLENDFSSRNSSCQLRHSSVYNGTILQVKRHILFSPASLVVSCNFDHGLCFGWSQSREDVFDWKPQSGSTFYSSGTGPPSDHTSGRGLLAFEIYSLEFSYINLTKTFYNWFMRQRAYVKILSTWRARKKRTSCSTCSREEL